MRKLTRYFYVTLFCALCGNMNGQTIDKVPIVDFDELAPLLHQDNDTTYVVNFWATWCGPCVKELPYFESLHENYSDEKIKIILVSLDFKKQVKSKLIPFINKRKLKSDVIVLYDPDADTWINKVSENWSGALPGTLIFKGAKRDFYEKTFHSQEELDFIIQPYLNSQP